MPAAASRLAKTASGHGSGRLMPVGAAAQSMRFCDDRAVGVTMTTASRTPMANRATASRPLRASGVPLLRRRC